MTDLILPSKPFVLPNIDKQVRELIIDYVCSGKQIPYLEGSFPRCFYITQRLVQLFQNSMKIYFPVYVAIFLVRFRRGGSAASHFAKTQREFMRSSLFAALYAMSLPYAYCYLRELSAKPVGEGVGLFVSFIFSCAICVETPYRWSEISLYVSSQWLEGFAHYLLKTKRVSKLNYWSVGLPYTESSLRRVYGDGLVRVLHRTAQRVRGR